MRNQQTEKESVTFSIKIEVTRGTYMQFQKPTLNRGRLGDKFTALANARPVESVSYFVNGVTITLCRLSHVSFPD